jgi:hypothetical protein
MRTSLHSATIYFTSLHLEYFQNCICTRRTRQLQINPCSFFESTIFIHQYVNPIREGYSNRWVYCHIQQQSVIYFTDQPSACSVMSYKTQWFNITRQVENILLYNSSCGNVVINYEIILLR